MRLGRHTTRILRLLLDGEWWTAPALDELLDMPAHETVYVYLRRAHDRGLVSREDHEVEGGSRRDIAHWRITQLARDEMAGIKVPDQRRKPAKMGRKVPRSSSVWDYAMQASQRAA